MNPESAPVPSPAAPVSAVRTPSAERYFAMDSVRSVAMLLGVLYHALLFGGGMMGGFGGGPKSAAIHVMDWIHSFRMPLFFLISGFFCHLMVGRYGTKAYVLKRWWRLGIPFVLTLFVLAGIKTVFPQQGFGGPGPRPPGGEGRPGGPGGPGEGGPGPGGFPGGEMPAPPPGFVPPFLAEFDKNNDGTLDEAEWKEARADMERRFAGNGPGTNSPAGRDGTPGFPGFGPDGGGPGEPPGPGAGPRRFGPPRGPGGPGGPGGFGFGQSNPMAEKLFGGAADRFRLSHLWFLWDTIVFATAAPLFAAVLGWLAARIGSGLVESIGQRLLRWGLVPLVLAAVSLGGQFLSGTSPGQPPSGMATIFGVFPDVLFHYDPDWPYFFTYFLAGWWMYRMRSGLDSVARLWLPTLAIGFAAYVASRSLPNNGPFGPPPTTGVGVRAGGYLLFGVAVAGTGFGLLGLFQRFLNRPTPVSRYLAETAFWIYLVHQDLLIMVVLNWVRPWGLAPLLQGVVAVLITVALALVAFELLIRPTPLTILFGPPRRKKVDAAPTATANN